MFDYSNNVNVTVLLSKYLLNSLDRWVGKVDK